MVMSWLDSMIFKVFSNLSDCTAQVSFGLPVTFLLTCLLLFSP